MNYGGLPCDLIELNKIREEFKSNQKYLDAIEGKTNIECFNTWTNELKERIFNR